MNLRYLWRSLSLVFVLWFALSPILCYASETATTNSAINYGVSTLDYTEDSPSNGQLNSQHFFSYYNLSTSSYKDTLLGYLYGVGSNYTGTISVDFNKSTLSSTPHFALVTYYFMNDNTLFVEKGDSFNLQISGLKYSYREHGAYSVQHTNGSSYYGDYTFGEGLINLSEPTVQVQLLLKGRSSSETYRVNCDTSVFSYSSNGIAILDLDVNDVPFDVYTIGIIHFFNYDFTGSTLGETQGYARYMNISSGFENSTFILSLPDETTGFLSSIIDWLRNIRDGITGVKDGVTNVVNGITQLPSKLWTVMENGIKGLFVPSETDITAMKDKWDTLLSDRFGVVYESGALLIDIANSVQESSTRETITFPTVSYNFSGTDFTFGGYEVDVIPNGFEFLADILKGVIDIVCTLAFINAMRRKYDELMMR